MKSREYGIRSNWINIVLPSRSLGESTERNLFRSISDNNNEMKIEVLHHQNNI